MKIRMVDNRPYLKLLIIIYLMFLFIPALSTSQTCIDNDGDGYGNPGDPFCTNGSATDCNDGNSAIHPGAPDENCNGIDENCNSITDEGYVSEPTFCGQGVCASSGEFVCVGGTIQNTCEPGIPTGMDQNCNGVDENCNGTADENYEPVPTFCGQGVCAASGAFVCIDGIVQNTCTPGTPSAEICNNIDDDCDGTTDEELTQPTACGVGACASTGIETCNAGVWGGDTCTAGIPGADDATCDGIDDDCDGQADEDYIPTPTNCGLGVCELTGQMNCTGGVLTDTCEPGPPIGNDTNCNGIDENCNGTADEAYNPTPTTCGVGVCASTGQLNCSGGVLTDTCAPGTSGTEGPIDSPTCNDTLDNDCDGVSDLNDGGCINGSNKSYRFERFWPTLQQPWYFRYSNDIAVDSDGYIYVSDSGYHRIQKLSSGGQVVTTWGSEGTGYAQFDGPYGIASDYDFVYVVDSFNNRIQRFSRDGKYDGGWGSYGTGDSQFNLPLGIAFGSNGYVYVADTGNNRIQKFSLGGTFLTKWGSYGTGDKQFDEPVGIAVDSNGYVYVADSKNNRIQKFGEDGMYQTQWGSYGTSDSQFDTPKGVAVDSSGNVYVVDSQNHRIQKFTSGGTFIRKWGSQGFGDGEFSLPRGISIDKDDYVYVVDWGNNRIQKFTLDGGFVAVMGSQGTGNGKFSLPQGIAADSSGNIHVVDSQNNRIQIFNSSGTYQTQWGFSGTGDGQFNIPQGVAVHSSGNIYVVDSQNYRIQKFSSSREYQAQWGSYGTGNNQFDQPKGIAVDSSGFVYVADTGNNRVQKFSANGVFEAKWGSYGTGDGQFDYPEGIAVDSSGFVYVADTGNNRIQKFTSNGVFVTKWGSHCFINDGEGCTDPDGTGPMQLGDGQFTHPKGMFVVDSGIDKYIYVVDSDNHRIQKFTLDGKLLSKVGGLGAGTGLFNTPGFIYVNNNKLYITDTLNNRVQVLKEVSESFKNKAIVVAGGGPYKENTMWAATQSAANFAYMTLLYQGFTKQDIYYLTADATVDLDYDGTADRDGDATMSNLEKAINSASDADNLFVYLVDHGGSETFRMSKTETLPASGSDSLDEWLDAIQCTGDGCISGDVILIYDACESGSFLTSLTPPSGEKRIVVTSTSSGQQAYFLNQGSVSFSSFFWTNVFNGSDVQEAFDNATSALSSAITTQTPQLTEFNDASAENTLIGNGTVISGSTPSIASISATAPSQSSSTLTANGVTGSDGISRVWAVILPPNYTQTASNNTVNGLPTVDLLPTATSGQYQATYDKLNIEGTYNISIYAKDRIGNISLPKTTTVSVNNPLRKRAIIVTGGSDADANWNGVKKGALAAYNALKFQGYVDSKTSISEEDIYFMSSVTFSGADIDGASTLGNLYSAITTWANNSSTQDVVLFMVGNGDTDGFRIGSTETLSATQLDTWLDTLQNTITGKVTVIYDAGYSGVFNSALAASNRILVGSSTGPAYFLSDGNVSFSRYFWGWVFNGTNVRDAYVNAKSTMSSYQTAQIDDNGNGTANESVDGAIAFQCTLGSGIKLGGNSPIAGTAMPAQHIYSSTSVIYTEDVTTTGTLDSVWAVITPPNYYPDVSDQPVTDLPEVTLTYNAVTSRYEGTYNSFTQFGTYKVMIYAKDTDGNISAVKETSVKQMNSSTDIFEDDDTYSKANTILVHYSSKQEHNFHDSGDADWVKFYAHSGETYEIKATNLGSRSVVVLELYGADGTTQIWSYDVGSMGSDVEKSWACTEDGLYFVKVTHKTSLYGNDTGYDLEIKVPTMPNAPGYVAGWITDSSTKAGIVGRATRTSNGDYDDARTDGYYTFPTASGSSISITATKTGYFSQTKTVNVTAGAYTTLNFALTADLTPTADFSASPTSGTAPLTVTFTNNSSGGDGPLSYVWDFDSTGNTDSTQTSPSYEYTVPGTYSVTLTVTDNDLDTNTLTNTNCISVCYSNANIVGSTNTYTSLQSAYNAAATGNTIQARAVTITENISFNRNVNITIQGGYNCDHSSSTGKTVISGNMTISDGKVMMENVQVQ